MEILNEDIFGEYTASFTRLENASQRWRDENANQLVADVPTLAPFAVVAALGQANLKITARLLCQHSILPTPGMAYAAICTGSESAVTLILNHGRTINASCCMN